MIKELPSGAKLEITVSPFAVAQSLYQAVLSEMKDKKVEEGKAQMENLIKDILCVGLSSKKIEGCLWECMKRVTYNDLRITQDTFEPIEARGDYLLVCYEVAKENILPFVKSLYALYALIQEKLPQSPASRPVTT